MKYTFQRNENLHQSIRIYCTRANTVAPQVLVGLNDVRQKIGTDVEFYVKGKNDK